jgi:glycine cleavage system H protein
MPHDLLTLFSAKAIEYPLALLYLALFVPFWKYLNPAKAAPRRARAAARPVAAPRPSWAESMGGAFALPADLLFHQGHTWARVEGDVVTVGVDDFGQKLVGALRAVRLPDVGAALVQGEKAWTLVASDAKTVDMVSPVDGLVLEVNAGAAGDPRPLAQDPYGEGWLLKIKPSRAAANARQLLSGSMARRWVEETCNALSTLSPEMDAVSFDGGAPVAGMLSAVDPQHWDETAKRFFLV